MLQDDDKRSPGHRIETREKIKRAARRLFAEHGIEDVTVRQIVASAGQRHTGAVGYYFSSKEALVEEILRDGARLLDDRRNAVLDALDARKRPPTVREIVELMVDSSIAADDDDEESYIRFFMIFTAHNREIFLRSVPAQFDRGYNRCIDHLRARLPHISRRILNERIICMLLAITNCLAVREVAFKKSGASKDEVAGRRILRSDTFLNSLIDFCEAGLQSPA